MVAISKTLVVFLLFNLTYFAIRPDLKRQHGDFSQYVKNDSFNLKALYQVKNINATNDSYNLKRLAFNLIHILPRRRSSNIRQE